MEERRGTGLGCGAYRRVRVRGEQGLGLGRELEVTDDDGAALFEEQARKS